MKRIAIIALALVGCAADWNKPTPVNPDNGVWIKCGADGGYCFRANEVCGAAGHACGSGECCSVYDDGKLFGLKKRPQSKAPVSQ